MNRTLATRVDRLERSRGTFAISTMTPEQREIAERFAAERDIDLDELLAGVEAILNDPEEYRRLTEGHQKEES